MEEWINVIKMLADDTRRSIVGLLLTHDLCVGALARRTNVTEAAVSQHLRLLREAGLVIGEKRGYYTHYRINREQLKLAVRGMQVFVAQEPENSNGCRYKQGKHICNGKETQDVPDEM